jgi:Fe-S-cluster-containing hydrogenase component 2
VDMDNCIGCRMCELVCSLKHYDECNPSKSYIRIIQNRDLGIYVPCVMIDCDVCGTCVEHCLPRALELLPWKEAIHVRKIVNRLGRFPAPQIKLNDFA